jgi:anti-anti-sigma factor
MSEGGARYAQDDGTWILKLSGDVRHPLSPALDALLDHAVADPELQNFVVDLSETETIDSTNLGVLARIANHMSARRLHRPTLVAPRPDVLTLLRAVCFDRIFDIVSGPQGATGPLEDLPSLETDRREALALVLEAHRRLCDIDQKTRDVFRDVVELIELELGQR